jgi:membrane protein implicated in regulation of membrane protease activity
MNILFFFWLSIALCFLIFEMGSPGLFFFLSFFFGALAAAGANFLAYGVITQALIFLGGSGIAMLGLKLWLNKDKQHRQEHTTNVYALYGKQALVLTDITPLQAGEVKVGGEIWSARSFHTDVIKAGAIVEVVHVEGSHVIVKETQCC